MKQPTGFGIFGFASIASDTGAVFPGGGILGGVDLSKRNDPDVTNVVCLAEWRAKHNRPDADDDGDKQQPEAQR